MTRWGVGTAPDSAHYIQTARRLLAASAGQVDPSTSLDGTHFGPLYSVLLAAGGPLDIDPLDTARWLNALLFGCNVLMATAFVRRSIPHVATGHMVVASLLVFAAVPLVTVHATALSEPFFLASTLVGLHMLVRHQETEKTTFLVGAAIAMGLSALTRYAGVACIGAGVATLLLLGRRRPFASRATDACLFGALGAAPLFGWILRNLSVTGAATDRDLVFHPVGMSHAWQALYTISGWMMIPPSAPDAVRLAIWTLVGIVTGAAFARRRLDLRAVPVAIWVAAIFITTYVGFLAISISLFDANTPFDDRILLPVLVAGLPIAFYALDDLRPIALRRPTAAIAGIACLIALLTVHVARGASVISAGYTEGWGLTSRAWRESATLADVRRLPAGSVIYSNAPEIIYLNTEKPARSIPKEVSAMSQRPNHDFAAQLSQAAQEIRTGCGIVVYFRNTGAEGASLSEEELTASLSVELIAEHRDGLIFGSSLCQR